MKERRALDILGQVNEKYVVEAAFTPKTKRKPVLRLGLAACLCLIIAGTFGGRSNNPIGFVLTAYAADGVGYEVSKTPTVIRNDMGTDFFSTYCDENRRVRVSCPFRMICEGDDIESISYSIIGEPTAGSLLEMEESGAWFASETSSEKRVPGDFPEYEVRRSASGTFITSYMGSSYTVAYNKQDCSETLLVFRVENDGDFWSANDINIIISVLHKDGTVLEKELFIHPVFDGGAGELHISYRK